ncbi:MAG: hypothetical protein ACLQVD_10540 [Capsulimonadaceae bacterium]
MDYVVNLDDRDYLSTTLDSPGIFPTLHEMLEGEDPDEVSAACLVIRNGLIGWAHSDAVTRFENEFGASQIPATLEHLLTSTCHWLHGEAIYTIGKIGWIDSLPVLHSIVPSFCESDPLCLPGLIFEIRWIESNSNVAPRCAEHLETMVQSPHFVTRWAAVGCAHRDEGILKRLRSDPHPAVCAEAIYVHERLLLDQVIHDYAPKEMRMLRRKLDKELLPWFDFETMSLRFEQYRRERQQNGYTMEELERFIEQLGWRDLHPIGPEL